MILLAAAGTNTQGPVVTLHGWEATVVVIGALALAITSVVTLWRLLIHPLLVAMDEARELTPVLRDIAVHVKPNGHPPLWKRVEQIEASVEVIQDAIARDPTARTRHTDHQPKRPPLV